MTYISILTFLIILAAVLLLFWHLYSDKLNITWRLYYLYNGFRSRNKSFDSNVLHYSDDFRKLIYFIPFIAASFTPVILFITKKKLVLACLAYTYWRILDTFDDLLTGEEREKGLGILHDRLLQLRQFGTAGNNAEIVSFKFSDVGPRDDVYIFLVNNIDDFDPIFLGLDVEQQDSLIRFVGYQTKNFASLNRKHVQTEAQYHEECISTIMSGLCFATFDVNKSAYRCDITEQGRILLEETCEAFETGNIIKDLEKDFRQGISYHPELIPRGIVEQISPQELKYIEHARSYLTFRGITFLPSALRLLRAEWNETFSTKLMALLLSTYLVNNYKMYIYGLIGWPYKKPNTKSVFFSCIFRTIWDWETGIEELDRDMLSWRPDKPPLWGAESIPEGASRRD
jgi:hypothetical protein